MSVEKHLFGNRQTILKESSEFVEPSREDIEQYASHIGIVLPEENELVWIAEAGLHEPLPPSWLPVEDSCGRVYYYNTEKDESTWEHPVDEFYRSLVQRERQQSASKASSLADVPPLHSSGSQESPKQDALASEEEGTSHGCESHVNFEMANFRKSTRTASRSVKFDLKKDEESAFDQFLDSIDAAHLSPILQKSPEPEDVNLLLQLAPEKLSDPYKSPSIASIPQDWRRAPLEPLENVIRSIPKPERKVEVLRVPQLAEDIQTALSDDDQKHSDIEHELAEGELEAGEVRLIQNIDLIPEEMTSEREKMLLNMELKANYDMQEEKKKFDAELQHWRKKYEEEVEIEKRRLADAREQFHKDFECEKEKFEQEMENTRSQIIRQQQRELDDIKVSSEEQYLKELDSLRISLKEQHEKGREEIVSQMASEHTKLLHDLEEKLKQEFTEKKKLVEEPLKKLNDEELAKLKLQFENELSEKKEQLSKNHETAVADLMSNFEESQVKARLQINEKIEENEDFKNMLGQLNHNMQLKEKQLEELHKNITVLKEQLSEHSTLHTQQCSNDFHSLMIERMESMDQRLISLESLVSKGAVETESNSTAKTYTKKKFIRHGDAPTPLKPYVDVLSGSEDGDASSSSQNSYDSYMYKLLLKKHLRSTYKARQFLKSRHSTHSASHHRIHGSELAKSVEELAIRLDEEARKMEEIQRSFITKRQTATDEAGSKLVFPMGKIKTTGEILETTRNFMHNPSIQYSQNKSASVVTTVPRLGTWECWTHQVQESPEQALEFAGSSSSFHSLNSNSNYWKNKLREMKKRIRSSENSTIQFTQIK